MEKVKIISNSEKETKKVGKLLGEEILKEKKPVFLALSGPLGAGKTTFLKGIAAGLGLKKRIFSPTFLIIKEHKLKNKRKFYHIDCYRLKSYKELKTLDFENILKEKNSVIAIEWPEKVLRYLPKERTVRVKINYLSQNKRKIEISAYEK